MLKIAGRKIYQFFDSVSGSVLFWGCALLIAVLCVAGILLGNSYLIPLELMALTLLIFIVVEYQRASWN
jgi:preprotein translocase subunit SecY